MNDHDNKFEHLCEVCGRSEMLNPDEAYEQGWDYPPRMGQWGVISSRKCNNCGIQDTAWWQLVCEHIHPLDLPENHRITVERILQEQETHP